MSDTPVRIRCPNLTCRKVLAVPQIARGKTVRCRSCGTNIRVPQKPTTPKKSEQAESASND
jgi:DNA-directed RNA polymerase subunit RPC12/RpoP